MSLTPAMCETLMIYAETIELHGRAPQITEIARRAKLSKVTIHERVVKLVEEGYLCRENVGRKKFTRYELTPKGRKAVGGSIGALQRAWKSAGKSQREAFLAWTATL